MSSQDNKNIANNDVNKPKPKQYSKIDYSTLPGKKLSQDWVNANVENDKQNQTSNGANSANNNVAPTNKAPEAANTAQTTQTQANTATLGNDKNTNAQVAANTNAQVAASTQPSANAQAAPDANAQATASTQPSASENAQPSASENAQPSASENAQPSASENPAVNPSDVASAQPNANDKVEDKNGATATNDVKTAQNAKSIKKEERKQQKQNEKQARENEKQARENEKQAKKTELAKNKELEKSKALAKLSPEEQALMEEEKNLRKLRLTRRRRQFFGAFALFLMGVGIISIVSLSVGIFTNAFDDSELKLEYENKMRYVVALDPLPFDSLSEAPLTHLLYAAMSYSIDQTEDLNSFEYDEYGALYLPIDTINAAIDQLYGPNVQFNFSDFTLNGLTFIYNAENDSYLMPITSVPTDFSPIVENIDRSYNEHIVTIGYDIPYDTVIQPVKYNDFVFTRNDDGNYYLTAIKTASATSEVAESSESIAAEDVLPEGTEEIFNSAVIEGDAATSGDLATSDNATSEDITRSGDVITSGEEATSGETTSADENTSGEEATSDETTSTDENTSE